MRIPLQEPSASGNPQLRFPNDSVFLETLSFATPTQLDLTPQVLQETVDERNTSAQLFVTELTEKREQAWRLDDGLLVASQCVTCCRRNTLEYVRVDCSKHFAKNHGVANGANGFIRFGGIDRGFNQLVACGKRATQQLEDAMVV
jgi:hypothetical protein